MSVHVKILKMRRAQLETYIEKMIALLDLLDGDCDLEDTGDDEPSLGGPAALVNSKHEDDLESATADEYGIADRYPLTRMRAREAL